MPFDKGQGGRQKGAKNKATVVKALVSNNLWEAISEKMTGEGIERYWQELMQLDGRDYLWGYNQLLEYFKPKLTRATLEGGDKPLFTPIIIDWGKEDEADKV